MGDCPYHDSTVSNRTNNYDVNGKNDGCHEDKESNLHDCPYHDSTVSNSTNNYDVNGVDDIENYQHANPHVHTAYDRKTLEKKLKKLEKMISSTNDFHELETYKQKKKEYKMALEK